MSARQGAVQYNIPRKTLDNKHSDIPKILVDKWYFQQKILRQILVCADWGIPLDSLDIRLIVKEYLGTLGRVVQQFKNNLPGDMSYRNFLNRHRDELTVRKCQNVKRARAAVGTEQISSYFDHLERSLDNIPAQNIVNFDDTNFSDDPGSKKMVFRREVKYPERNINLTKGCISVMFTVSAIGEVLLVENLG